MVDVAINDARDSLFFRSPEDVWDWAIPVLFMRGDGMLFAPGERSTLPLNARAHQARPVEPLVREEKEGLRGEKPAEWGQPKPAAKPLVISVVRLSIPVFLYKGTGDEGEMSFHTSMFHGRIQENLTKTPGLQILDPEAAETDIILSGELNYFRDRVAVTIRGTDAGGVVRVSVTKDSELARWEDLSERCVGKHR